MLMSASAQGIIREDNIEDDGHDNDLLIITI